jgi:hypothetical protein
LRFLPVEGFGKRESQKVSSARIMRSRRSKSSALS